MKKKTDVFLYLTKRRGRNKGEKEKKRAGCEGETVVRLI